MFTARQNLAFFAELAGKTGLKKKDYDNVMRTVGLPEKALHMRLKESFPCCSCIIWFFTVFSLSITDWLTVDSFVRE